MISGGNRIRIPSGDVRGWSVHRDQGQADFKHQSALRPVGSRNRSTVQANCPLGDSQPQPDTSGVTLAGIIDAVERLKYLVEGLGRNARSGVGDTHDRLQTSRSLPLLQPHLDVAVRLGVT